MAAALKHGWNGLKLCYNKDGAFEGRSQEGSRQNLSLATTQVQVSLVVRFSFQMISSIEETMDERAGKRKIQNRYPTEIE